MSKNFDIAVIGGGMVGSLAAYVLAEHGLHVVVVEPYPVQGSDTKNIDDFRGLALSHITVDTLRSYGLWGNIEPFSNPIKGVHLSERGKFGCTLWHAGDYSLESLGHVVEAGRLTLCLQECIQRHKNISYLSGDKVSKYNLVNGKWELTMCVGSMIKAKLLVGADGVNSNVREALGILALQHDFEQVAVVSNIELSSSHNNLAYERFCDDYALALVPFTDRSMKSIFVVDKNKAEVVLSKTKHELAKLIFEQMSGRIPKVREVFATKTFPLKQRRALNLVGPKSMLIGNAALIAHPIAAQGYNLAVADVIHLSKLIQNNLNDFTCSTLLKSYEQTRQSAHQQVIDTTSSILGCFKDSSVYSSIARKLGIIAAQASPYLKDMALGRLLNKEVLL